MPFTFSHPVIIIPVKKVFKGLSLTGLVVGSMIPDLGYLLGVGNTDKISQIIPELFLFNLPFTIIFSFAFHNYLRNMIINFLPYPFNRNYSGWIDYNFNKYVWKNWYMFLLSCITGILSHILLDYFFESGLVFSSNNKLYEMIFAFAGFIFILLYLFFYSKVDLIQLSIITAGEKIFFWTIFFFLTIIFSLLKIFFLEKNLSFSYILVDIISSGIISILLLSLFYKKRFSYNS